MIVNDLTLLSRVPSLLSLSFPLILVRFHNDHDQGANLVLGKELEPNANLMRSIAEQICTQPVHWIKAISTKSVTHVLDFGPGHATGIGALTHKTVDGSGIQVILAGTVEIPVSHLQSRRHLFGSSPSFVKYGTNWGEKYRPKLAVSKADGKVYVDTAFGRLLGITQLVL